MLTEHTSMYASPNHCRTRVSLLVSRNSKMDWWSYAAFVASCSPKFHIKSPALNIPVILFESKAPVLYPSHNYICGFPLSCICSVLVCVDRCKSQGGQLCFHASHNVRVRCRFDFMGRYSLTGKATLMLTTCAF